MGLDKSKKIERLKTMLTSLGQEHTIGGFNEYSQFCEEALDTLLVHLSDVGLNTLTDMIEDVSIVGITRHRSTLDLV